MIYLIALLFGLLVGGAIYYVERSILLSLVTGFLAFGAASSFAPW